jgi:hypothetical protein
MVRTRLVLSLQHRARGCPGLLPGAIGGRYFADCNEAPVIDPKDEDSRGFGVAAFALDPANAARLWDLSLEAVGR